jgi:hypothetical protein
VVAFPGYVTRRGMSFRGIIGERIRTMSNVFFDAWGLDRIVWTCRDCGASSVEPNQQAIESGHAHVCAANNRCPTAG